MISSNIPQKRYKQLIFDGDRWYCKKVTDLERELLIEDFKLKAIKEVAKEILA